jgi:hypothetical protein
MVTDADDCDESTAPPARRKGLIQIVRHFVFVLATAAIVVGVATSVAAATVNAAGPRVEAAGCPSGSKRALIGGKVKCLRTGQKCVARYRAAYKKHGFTCVNGRLRKRSPAPPPAPTPPPTPPTPPPPPPLPAQPGHYKGTTSQLEIIEFDVTADGARIVSLLTGQINEGCNPPAHLYGGNLHDGTAPIASDGTFKIDLDYTSAVGGNPSKGHFTLTGKFSGTGFTGTLQDNVSFTDQGTGYTCGSGLQTWTASKDRLTDVSVRSARVQWVRYPSSKPRGDPGTAELAATG